MLLKTVELTQIDETDHTFAISPSWLPCPQLLDSIVQTGLLAPLRLRRLEGRFQIVSGFRRCRVLKSLGRETTLAFLTDSKSDLELYTETILENRSHRIFLEIEKAMIIRQLSRHFQLSDEDIIQDYLKLLDIRPDRRHLKRYIAISALPKQIQMRMLSGLSTEMALALASWDKHDQTFFLALVSALGLGLGKQRQLFTLLDDLKDIRQQPIIQVWTDSGASQASRREGLAPSDQYRKALRLLQQLRYPRQSQFLEKLERLRGRLQLPDRAQLKTSETLEGERFELSLAFRSPSELGGMAGRLHQLAESPQMQELFLLCEETEFRCGTDTPPKKS